MLFYNIVFLITQNFLQCLLIFLTSLGIFFGGVLTPYNKNGKQNNYNNKANYTYQKKDADDVIDAEIVLGTVKNFV